MWIAKSRHTVLALAFAGSLTGAPLSAFFVRRIGQRPTAFAGVALVGLGLLPLGFTGAATPVMAVALLLIVEGVGQGLLTVAYTAIVTATLAPKFEFRLVPGTEVIPEPLITLRPRNSIQMTIHARH